MSTMAGSEKEFLDIFKSLCYSRQPWQVWSDLITAIACSLSNVTDRTPEHFEQRETEYTQCIKRLGSVDAPAKMLGIIVMALEHNPEQDFLGRLYMALELGNHWKGQFFTPYSICRMMSQITVGTVDKQIEHHGYISICDPACGAGATLIAAANTLKNSKYNFQNHVLFVGQDIDRVVAQMCYIQLSLLGCAGYICIGNTLTNPLSGHALFPQEKEGQELWYMPMFQAEVWNVRRMFKTMGIHHKMWGVNVNNQNEVDKDNLSYVAEGEEHLPKEETISEGQEECTTKENEEIVKTQAKKKLENELENEKNKSFAEPIIQYLLNRCEEDKGLSEDILQEHKTWEKCFNYVYSQASKQSTGAYVAVHDEVVYEWAEDYYHKDDKAEEENKGKQVECKKQVEHKKNTKQKKKESKADVPAIVKSKPKENKIQEKPKPKKSKKNNQNVEIEGQMDLFSLMGM